MNTPKSEQDVKDKHQIPENRRLKQTNSTREQGKNQRIKWKI
jgi:hypothetical protein